MTAYFAVKGWKDHQHYKDRAPPWIKFHVALLENYEFGRLQDASKAHLLSIWLLASKHDNRIPVDPVWVGKRINATEPVDLGVLIEAGFLVVEGEEERETQAKTTQSQAASKPLVERSESAPSESREQKEDDADDAGGRSRVLFDPITDRVIEAAEADPQHQADWMTASAHVAKWTRRFDLELDILPAIRKAMVSRRGQGPPNGPSYFDKAILEAHERRLRPLPTLVNGHGGRSDGRTARQSDHDARRAAQGDALRRAAEGG